MRAKRALLILALPAMILAQTAFPPTSGPKPVPADSAARNALPNASDSLALAPPKSRSDTVIVVKHGFNHREQIITGSVIMSCLALMLVTMNNYNPR